MFVLTPEQAQVHPNLLGLNPLSIRTK